MRSIILSSVVALCLFSILRASSEVASTTTSEIKAFPARPNEGSVDYSAIINSCYEYLESHLCEGEKWDLPFHFYRPSIEKYSPDQWLWDSGAHMIVWSQRNVTNAILDLRSMLQMQQPDGMIPEQIYWSDRTPAEEAEILLTYSNTKFTDITQMPVLPYSLRAIYSASQDKTVLKEFLYPLVRYFQWWHDTRDQGDGLMTAIHNWETGLDASPAYDPAFHEYITDVNETSLWRLYPDFIEVIESYKLIYKWNVTAILERETAPEQPERLNTWFMMKDLALNCVYASGWRVLGELADELGDTELAAACATEATRASQAIQTKMWDAESNSFQSVYKDVDGVNKFSIANSVQNMFPLLLSDLPADKVQFLVDQLRDETKFLAKYSIPTVAMDDPQFCPTFDADLMWRGPVWGFTNWFLLEGLQLHGELNLQEEILSRWVSVVDKTGIYEMYNPLTGEGYGPEGLGMSTLVCDWMAKYGWV